MNLIARCLAGFFLVFSCGVAFALEECSPKGIQGCGTGGNPPERTCPKGHTCPRKMTSTTIDAHSSDGVGRTRLNFDKLPRSELRVRLDENLREPRRSPLLGGKEVSPQLSLDPTRCAGERGRRGGRGGENGDPYAIRLGIKLPR